MKTQLEKMINLWIENLRKKIYQTAWSGLLLCHPLVQGGISMNSSNSFTWTSQHFHYTKKTVIFNRNSNSERKGS